MTCFKIKELLIEADGAIKQVATPNTSEALQHLHAASAGLVDLTERLINLYGEFALGLPASPNRIALIDGEMITVELQIPKDELTEILALATNYFGATDTKSVTIAVFKTLLFGRDEIKLRIFRHD